MFENVRKLFSKDRPFIAAVGETSAPAQEVKEGRRAWVVLVDGRVGYIDHYKDDGKFGVRPVDKKTGLHFPNPSQHWTIEQRLKVPEELALSLKDFRAAEDADIPSMYKGNS